MRRGAELPRIAPTATLAQGLLEMSRKGMGMTVIVDPQDTVLGVFTDGDLRRLLDRQVDIHTLHMQDVMTAKCRTIGPHELAAEGVHLMDQHRITVLPVIADGRLLGAFNVARPAARRRDVGETLPRRKSIRGRHSPADPGCGWRAHRRARVLRGARRAAADASISRMATA